MILIRLHIKRSCSFKFWSLLMSNVKDRYAHSWWLFDHLKSFVMSNFFLVTEGLIWRHNVYLWRPYRVHTEYIVNNTIITTTTTSIIKIFSVDASIKVIKDWIKLCNFKQKRLIYECKYITSTKLNDGDDDLNYYYYIFQNSWSIVMATETYIVCLVCDLLTLIRIWSNTSFHLIELEFINLFDWNFLAVYLPTRLLLEMQL